MSHHLLFKNIHGILASRCSINLVYIIVSTLHIFNFWRGSKSANGGPYFTSRFAPPPGFISARRFGPGGPYLLVDMDRGSKSTGVQINWDTGTKPREQPERNHRNKEPKKTETKIEHGIPPH